MNKEQLTKDLKSFRDYIYDAQWDFEDTRPNSNLLAQSVQVSQRVRALLDIYSQILNGREFDKEYLKKYLK